jgi:ATPase
MPSGMMSADLARPVIEVTSFLENKLKYEIYTFGEQVVVMPLDQIQSADGTKKKNIVFDAAGEHIGQLMSEMFSFPVECEVV